MGPTIITTATKMTPKTTATIKTTTKITTKITTKTTSTTTTKTTFLGCDSVEINLVFVFSGYVCSLYLCTVKILYV